MTNSEAIASEIQPFSTADEAIEKMFIDATDRFNITSSVDDEYSVEDKCAVAYAAMRILYKMKVLSSENIGGISQSYKDKNAIIDDMIRSIAKDSGLDADMVLDSDSDDYWLRAVKMW